MGFHFYIPLNSKKYYFWDITFWRWVFFLVFKLIENNRKSAKIISTFLVPLKLAQKKVPKSQMGVITKGFIFGPKSEAFWKGFTLKVKPFKKCFTLGPKSKAFSKGFAFGPKSEAFLKGFTFKVKPFQKASLLAPKVKLFLITPNCLQTGSLADLLLTILPKYSKCFGHPNLKSKLASSWSLHVLPMNSQKLSAEKAEG